MKQGLCDRRSHLGWVVFSSWTWTIPEHPWCSQEWDSEATISASCLLAAVQTFFRMVPTKVALPGDCSFCLFLPLFWE